MTDSNLKTQLKSDLTVAMKARDEVRSATLRMALTAVTNEEVSGKSSRELSDDDVVLALTKEAKKRREAVTAYQEAGRNDLAERESAELAVLSDYLPAQLEEAELDAIITGAITESGADGPRGMGAVMKIVQPQVAGRADGSQVAAEVKRRLIR